MKTVLIISFTDLARDPRVNRQIRFLKDNYNVTAVGTADPRFEGVRYINCEMPGKSLFKQVAGVLSLCLKKYEGHYWAQKHIVGLEKKLREVSVDIVIANDIETLPFALRIARGAKVILDAHEYAPRESEDIWHWRLYIQPYKQYLCKRYIPSINRMLTVCPGLADEYERNYGIKPSVITNAPDYANIEPLSTSPQEIRLIYHGGATTSRKLENMIRMMDYLDDHFKLDLILVPGDLHYIKQLKKMAKNNASIRFLPPRPMHELVKFSSQYDIGLYLLEPTNFNNKHALPNKFFEFIQARLAIAIGPSLEMANIVKKYDCGVVSDDFSPESLARSISKLDEKKIDYFKGQSHSIAKIMSSEANKTKLLKIIKDI